MVESYNKFQKLGHYISFFKIVEEEPTKLKNHIDGLFSKKVEDFDEFVV